MNEMCPEVTSLVNTLRFLFDPRCGACVFTQYTHVYLFSIYIDIHIDIEIDIHIYIYIPLKTWLVFDRDLAKLFTL